MSRGTLLVIDDEMGPRESLRIVFKNDYVVLLAETVDQGLDHLKQNCPDTIIMDIRMPGKTGIQGLEEIRALDPLVSVVMLTGFGALETAQQAIRLGANDYLKKPFDTKEIMEVIDRNVKRTKVERRRVKVSEELRGLNSELVEELTVKEHMATLGHASAEFVHDLRNPLTVVHGYAQLLEEELDGIKEKLGDDVGETFEYLDIISRNVQRCYDITELWRNIGKSEGSMERVRLGDVVRDSIRSAEPMAASGGARLEADIPETLPEIDADSIQLFRVVQNLVTNALHSLPESGGVIRLVCGEADGEVFLRVQDNGCGMSSGHIAKIFEPYYTTKKFGKGTGLGLAITKKVVENHRGRIEVESTEGEGSSFTIYFPAAG